MSALAVVPFLTEDREPILDNNKRQVFLSFALLALLGVFIPSSYEDAVTDILRAAATVQARGERSAVGVHRERSI